MNGLYDIFLLNVCSRHTFLVNKISSAETLHSHHVLVHSGFRYMNSISFGLRVI